jgi:hypothetical protein
MRSQSSRDSGSVAVLPQAMPTKVVTAASPASSERHPVGWHPVAVRQAPATTRPESFRMRLMAKLAWGASSDEAPASRGTKLPPPATVAARGSSCIAEGSERDSTASLHLSSQAFHRHLVHM